MTSRPREREVVNTVRDRLKLSSALKFGKVLTSDQHTLGRLLRQECIMKLNHFESIWDMKDDLMNKHP